MFVFWNLLQDHRYLKERERIDELEKRLQRLEAEFSDLNDLMKKMLYRLETRFNEDLNGDGAIGQPKLNSPKLPPKWKPIELKKVRGANSKENNQA